MLFQTAIPLLLLLAAPVPVPPGFGPPPTDWIRGSTLVVDSSNMQIESPFPRTAWYYKDDPSGKVRQQHFFAVSDKREAVSVTVFDLAVTWREEDAAAFQQDVSKSVPRGWQVVEAKLENAALPIKAIRFRTVNRLPGGATAYQHGYYLNDLERTYMIQETTLEPQESSALRAFATSFRFIRPLQARPWYQDPPYRIALVLILFTLVPGVAMADLAFVSLVRGEPVVPASLAEAAGVQSAPTSHAKRWPLTLVGTTVLGTFVHEILKISSHGVAGAVGATIGSMVFPLLVAIGVAVRPGRTNGVRFARILFWGTLAVVVLLSRSGASPAG